MRVAMVSRFPSSVLTPKGGVESATVNLVDGLARRSDVDLVMLTLEHGIDEPVVDVVDGIEVHRLPRSSWPMFIDILFGPSKRLLENYVRQLNPDIVHYQESWGLGAYKLDLPHLMTVHGFDSLNLPTEGRRGWQVRSKIWQSVESFTLARHKDLISIAPYVTDQIGTTSAQVIDISNAISRSLFDMQAEPVANRIFYAGWLDRRKNLVGLLKVVLKLRDELGINVSLRAAGTASDPAYKAEIDEFIHSNDLAGNVELLGQIDQKAVRRELSEASVLALLSYQENAPMIISEAMALGVPVVCSDLCGMVSMVENDHRGYRVDPDDISSAADAMASIFTDPDRRSRLSGGAMDYARLHYHPDAVAARTVDAYRGVVERNRASGSCAGVNSL